MRTVIFLLGYIYYIKINIGSELQFGTDMNIINFNFNIIIIIILVNTSRARLVYVLTLCQVLMITITKMKKKTALWQLAQA